jgi:hypothetical protein
MWTLRDSNVYSTVSAVLYVGRMVHHTPNRGVTGNMRRDSAAPGWPRPCISTTATYFSSCNLTIASSLAGDIPFVEIDAQSPIHGNVVPYKRGTKKPKHNEGLGRRPQRLGVCIMLPTIVHTVPRFQVCSDSPAANG